MAAITMVSSEAGDILLSCMSLAPTFTHARTLAGMHIHMNVCHGQDWINYVNGMNMALDRHNELCGVFKDYLVYIY